jgi:hypothetical protein
VRYLVSVAGYIDFARIAASQALKAFCAAVFLLVCAACRPEREPEQAPEDKPELPRPQTPTE